MYEDTTTYLIFSVHSHRYALPSPLIQEIMQDVTVHFLPFVPSYIEGIINCHGKPYTVINHLAMFDIEDDTEISEQTFLVLKRSDDQFCLHVSNIDLFYEPEEDDVLENSIMYKNKEIEIFNADKIEETLRKDLGYE